MDHDHFELEFGGLNLAEKEVHNDGKVEYFSIAEPAPKDVFLQVTNEVIEAALFVFAPFGLPKQFRHAYAHEDMFTQKFASAFQEIVENLSESIYEDYNVTESEMAVAMHKYVEEERDPGAIEAVRRMLEALGQVYAPPRVLELPASMTALEVQTTAAEFAAAQSRLATAEVNEGGGGGGGGEEDVWVAVDVVRPGAAGGGGGSVCRTKGFRFMYPQVFSSLGFKLCEHQRTKKEQKFVGDWESSPAKDVCEKWTNLKQALKPLNKKMRQIHLQAFVESYLVEEKTNSDYQTTIATACEGSFIEDHFFMFCKNLHDSGCLEELRQVQVSSIKNALGEAKKANRDLNGALAYYEGAAAAGFGYAPDEELAACLANAAAVRYARHLVGQGDEARARGELGTALALDPCSPAALQVRGHLRLAEGDLRGAVRDLVLGFDLQGSGRGMELNDMANDAQIIEFAARDLVREEALELYLDGKSPATGSSPAVQSMDRSGPQPAAAAKEGDGDEAAAAAAAPPEREPFDPPAWLVDSYLASFSDEPTAPMAPPPPPPPPPGPGGARPGEDLNAIDEDDGPSGEGGPPAGPTEAQRLYNRGLAHKAAGEYGACLGCFQAALEAAAAAEDADKKGGAGGFPGGEEEAALALNQAGTFLYLSGRIKEGLRLLQDSAARQPGLVNSLLKVAGLYCDMDEKEEALAWFDRALGASDSPDIYLHRAQLYLMKNENRLAANDLRRCEARHEAGPGGEEGVPALVRATLGIACFKMDMGSPLRLRQIERAHRLHPDNVEVLLFYGEMLTQVGDFKKALALFRRAAEVSPRCPLPFVNAGRAYLSLNDHAAARAHFARALAVDPLCSAAFLDLGQLLLNRAAARQGGGGGGGGGGPRQALACYRKAAACARYLSEVQEALACREIALAHLAAQEFKEDQRRRRRGGGGAGGGGPRRRRASCSGAPASS